MQARTCQIQGSRENLGTPTVILSAKEGLSAREMELLVRMKVTPWGSQLPAQEAKHVQLPVLVLLELRGAAGASGKENELQNGM